MQDKNQAKIGFICALAAFITWGVFPIYFKQLNALSANEIVAHRIVWSVLLLFLLLKFSRKLGAAKKILGNKKTAFWLFVTGLLIGANWWIYIYAVNIGKIVEASLGYFINPLVNMLLGVIILKEKLTRAGKFALGVVFVAIGVQIYDAGGLPVISIILPITFGFYSLIRKRLGVPSFEGLFAETALIAPIALAALFFVAASGQNHFSFSWFGLFIALCGPATVVPLLLFNSAATRLNLSTIGYLQYISPSMQLLLAVFYYGEPVSALKALSFLLIWSALAVVSFSAIYSKKSKISV